MCLRDVSTSHHNSSSSHALSQQPPCFLPYPTWRNRGPFFSRPPCSYKASKQDLLPSWKYQLSYIPLGSPLRCSWDWENGHCSCVTHPPQLSTSNTSAVFLKQATYSLFPYVCSHWFEMSFSLLVDIEFMFKEWTPVLYLLWIFP